MAVALGIHAYVGKNGHGKTLRMVEELVLPALAAGRSVVSNVRVFESADDADVPRHLWATERKPHPLWVPYVHWQQILDMPFGAQLCLDEITSAFGARESAKLPFQIAAKLNQLRKQDFVVGWTAPSWKRADVILREVTDFVTLCKGYLPEPAPQAANGMPRRRGSNRLFRYRTYDVKNLGEFQVEQANASGDKRNGVRPLDLQWRLRSRHHAQLMYDTFEPVGMLDHLDHHGTCVRCGGKRMQPRCGCPDEELMLGV